MESWATRPVDFYPASRTHTQLAGAFAVGSIWVGDMQRKMESAVRVFAVDGVLAFGRFLVASLRLRTHWITTQNDFVSFENLPVIEQR